jgi:hypothetical protein
MLPIQMRGTLPAAIQEKFMEIPKRKRKSNHLTERKKDGI